VCPIAITNRALLTSSRLPFHLCLSKFHANSLRMYHSVQLDRSIVLTFRSWAVRRNFPASQFLIDISPLRLNSRKSLKGPLAITVETSKVEFRDPPHPSRSRLGEISGSARQPMDLFEGGAKVPSHCQFAHDATSLTQGGFIFLSSDVVAIQKRV
jgi:hypothetical protein